jgi:hypothetical protein
MLLSPVAVVTGKVANICSIALMAGEIPNIRRKSNK